MAIFGAANQPTKYFIISQRDNGKGFMDGQVTKNKEVYAVSEAFKIYSYFCSLS